jgi:hypothetical protein
MTAEPAVDLMKALEDSLARARDDYRNTHPNGHRPLGILCDPDCPDRQQ